ncbi:unnamed protein product, partial [Durusdinium trenchii]
INIPSVFPFWSRWPRIYLELVAAIAGRFVTPCDPTTSSLGTCRSVTRSVPLQTLFAPRDACARPGWGLPHCATA